MRVFDEALLDEPERLEQRDEQRLLWSLATAGAQVRRAVETVGDFGVERLRAAELPRALLVATDSAPSAASRLVTRLSCTRTPALTWHGVELPRWAGPADALLIGSVDGRHPRLAELAAQGARRGLAMAVVAPAGSQVAAAAGRAPLHELPRDLHPRAARWSVLAPLLQALDALGVNADPVRAARSRSPTRSTRRRRRAGRPATRSPTRRSRWRSSSPTRTPLIAGAGALAGVAARAISDALQQFAGVSSVSVSPARRRRPGPASLLRGAGPAPVDDFFRDRLDEEPARARPRLLVVGDDGSADDLLLGRSLGRADPARRGGRPAGGRGRCTTWPATSGCARRRSTSPTATRSPGSPPPPRSASSPPPTSRFGLGLDPGSPGPAERAH